MVLNERIAMPRAGIGGPAGPRGHRRLRYNPATPLGRGHTKKFMLQRSDGAFASNSCKHVESVKMSGETPPIGFHRPLTLVILPRPV
jgi:hypothetical protein